MVVTAILSDIHSNIEALTAVLKDVEEHKADEIVCHTIPPRMFGIGRW